MASKAKKKYTYLTKALLMPDGTRKYIRAKTQEELDCKGTTYLRNPGYNGTDGGTGGKPAKRGGKPP